MADERAPQSLDADADFERRNQLLKNAVTGFAGLFIGVVAAWQSLQLSVFARDRPGEGLYPLIIAIAIIVLSLRVLWPVLAAAVGSGGAHQIGQAISELPLGGMWKIGQIALATILAAVLIEPLGMVTVLLLFFLAVLLWIERRTPWIAVPVATALAAGFYVLFAVFLGIPFPRGPLGV